MSYENKSWKVTPYVLEEGEEYMNQKQLDHFKEILLHRKNELMVEVDHTLDDMKATEVEPDPLDRATIEEVFSLELKARDRERKLIIKIDNMLQKIDDHEYGNCKTCGAEIGLRRLEARPTAEQCIDCKTLDEISEKRNVIIDEAD